MAKVEYGKDERTEKFNGVVTITLDNSEKKLVKEAHDGQLVKDDEGNVVAGHGKAAKAGREQLMSLLQNALNVEATRVTKSAGDYDREIQRLQNEKAAAGNVDVPGID